VFLELLFIDFKIKLAKKLYTTSEWRTEKKAHYKLLFTRARASGDKEAEEEAEEAEENDEDEERLSPVKLLALPLHRGKCTGAEKHQLRLFLCGHVLRTL